MLNNENMEYLQKFFPFWDNLKEEEKIFLAKNVVDVEYKKGSIIYNNEQACKGLMFIKKGQLRTFIVSEEGREVTLFRVRTNDVCVLSASCLMESLVFNVMIDAIEDTSVLMIPSEILAKVIEKHMEIELYLYKASTEHFSDIIWMVQQILFLGVDKRVARFIFDETQMIKSNSIYFTHDEIARLIGSAREVVTKVLKYFSDEGLVVLGRGKITVKDKEKLKKYL